MGEKVRSYRDLRVWNEGMLLAEACYRTTRAFPKDEVYGMNSQVRRSAASIPANVAEGYGRENPREYVRFLRIAQGSVKELETHLMLASRVGLVDACEIDAVLRQCETVGKMLRSLIRSIHNKSR